jgi:lipopolysaccharide transport system permease protein
MTTKYRDLAFLVTFGVPLMMYAAPIIYPLSGVHNPAYLLLLKLNPLTSLFETFKYAFFGVGYFSWLWLLYSAVFTSVLLILGTLVFNKVEKRFIDTV